MIKSFNNRNEKVGDDLKLSLDTQSKVDIAAGIFSIYGFHALKSELRKIDKLRFIFTDPTFIENDKNRREKKQFQINSLLRQKAISGSGFELNLRNELKGRAIARECKKWIEQKVEFRSNSGNKYIQPVLNLSNESGRYVYSGINEFSSAGLGYEKDNSILNHIIKTDDFDTARQYFQNFEEIWNDKNLMHDVTAEVREYIANLYKENSPAYIYYFILYPIFNEFLEDISEDQLANEKTGFKNSFIWNKLYDFQRDAVLGVINKLEQFNGCILADSVGLGKTFTALGVMKYYQERNRSILVLCPKKLGDNWLTFLNNYDDNPFIQDRLNYDVLHHTDLLRKYGYSNGLDLSRINWGNYDLVIIDESHNFRNNDPRLDRVTRYQALLQNVMKKGVKTKVLMLSATPVNNRFNDLKNQLALAFEGRTAVADKEMGILRSVDSILRNAQSVFSEWMKLPEEERTSKNLLDHLSSNFDFFKLLDSVTIARSRRHIEKYYNMNAIGRFPDRLPPVTHRADITNLPGVLPVADLYNQLAMLNMSVYSPFLYILPGRMQFYSDLYDTNVSEYVSFKQSHREDSLQTLMRINMLKRLESSVESFRISLRHFINKIEALLTAIDKFDQSSNKSADSVFELAAEPEVDYSSEDWFNEDSIIGDKVKINLADMNTSGWRADLTADVLIARQLLINMNQVTPEHDAKLNDLKRFIRQKQENPINPGNKKILIFSAFADTVNYLYTSLAGYNKINHNLETAKITGSDDNKATIRLDSNSFHSILLNFSPKSKNRRATDAPEIDILIATDCISEGQNLQDCDMVINYDIHWNPVRIIQRFGRIDRLGSLNKQIQLVNFWPQLSLDDYIQLKRSVESKMHIVDITATGQENPLSQTSADLQFRKAQLERLQKEIVDLEEMGSGISITDLGLNDFRMDLITYVQQNGPLDEVANGIHTVTRKDDPAGIPEGVIYVLKNRNPEINTDNTNQLHPFYMVYISKSGEVISDHIGVKSTLDILRKVCRHESQPIPELFERFNDETEDGKNMKTYSDLLSKSIEAILQVKTEKEIDSLFTPGGTTALTNKIKGLEDFELISFVVVG